MLARSFGLAGGLRCELDLDAVPTIMTPVAVWVGYSLSFLEQVELRRCDRRPDDMICYIAGVDRREKAEALVDRGLWLPAEALEYDNPNIHPRLIGYDVVDPDGAELGVVSSILRSAAHPIWGIARDGFERLVPAVEPFIVAVDHEHRRVVIRPIPGLLDDDFEVSRGDNQE